MIPNAFTHDEIELVITTSSVQKQSASRSFYCQRL